MRPHARMGKQQDSDLRWVCLWTEEMPRLCGKVFTDNGDEARWREILHAASNHINLQTPFARARIKLTRCSVRQPSEESLHASFTPVLKALTRTVMGPKHQVYLRAGVIYDDREPYLEEPPTVVWEKCKKEEQMIEVYVEELPEPEGFVHAPLLIIGPRSVAELRELQASWSGR